MERFGILVMMKKVALIFTNRIKKAPLQSHLQNK